MPTVIDFVLKSSFDEIKWLEEDSRESARKWTNQKGLQYWKLKSLKNNVFKTHSKKLNNERKNDLETWLFYIHFSVQTKVISVLNWLGSRNVINNYYF